jgi:hypothetical protein
MEAWTLTKYVAPYLAVDAVRFDSTTNEVLVLADLNEYVIEHGEHLSGDEVARRLDALREPGSGSWKDVLTGGMEGEWFELLESMDHLGLLRDQTSFAKIHQDQDQAQLRDGIRKLVNAVMAEVPGAHLSRLLDNVERLAQHYAVLAWEVAREYPLQHPVVEVPGRPMASVQILAIDNFYQQLALLQALYQRSSAPLSLVCCASALFEVHSRLQPKAEAYPDLSELLCELSGGAYSAQDALRHLNGLAEALISGADPQRSKRYFSDTYATRECTSGIDFMLEAEKVARRVLSRAKMPRYLQALEESNDGLVLVHGRYLQDYRVTTRFPEIIAAILPKRLNDDLRAKAFRYYKEEVGHDVLEYESCIELGLTEEQVKGTEPLPLHFSYVDVFSQLGAVDPIVYTTSIFVTEGLIGESSPLDRAYKKIIGNFMSLDKHILLNEKYHHTSIPRLFMDDVKAISPAVQRLSLEYMVLMLELNYRAWDDLVDFYQLRDSRFFRVLPKPPMLS